MNHVLPAMAHIIIIALHATVLTFLKLSILNYYSKNVSGKLEYYECHISCKTCNIGGENNCSECNISRGYYPVSDKKGYCLTKDNVPKKY